MDPTKAPPTIMSLPPEIVSRIFILSTQATTRKTTWPDYPPIDNTNPRKLHLTITSVCRVWRNIACSTSELWSICWLSYKTTDLNTYWLARTGKGRLLELDGLHVPWALQGAPRRSASSTRLLDSILSFIPRCRSLSIDSDLFEDEERELIQPPHNIDALHLLHASFLGRSFPSWFLAVLRGAPNLQSLVIDLAFSFPTNTNISFSNLTSLKVRRLYRINPLLSVLENAPKLKYLSVNGPDDISSQGPLLIVTLHFLTSFTLLFADDPGILDILRVPSLQCLKICSDTRWFHADNIPQLLTFVQHSQCTLQELIIDAPDADTILSILGQPAICSSLKVFSCPWAKVDERFFALVNDGTILPHLCSLKFGQMYRRCIPLLVDMLSERRRRNDRGKFVENACLERVELALGFADTSYFDHQSEEAAAGVQAVAEELGIILVFPSKEARESSLSMIRSGFHSSFIRRHM